MLSFESENGRIPAPRRRKGKKLKMNKARFAFWTLFLVSAWFMVWYCFAFIEVAFLAEGASDCGKLVGILVVFGFCLLPEKARRAVENYIVGGIDDA